MAQECQAYGREASKGRRGRTCVGTDTYLCALVERDSELGY